LPKKTAISLQMVKARAIARRTEKDLAIERLMVINWEILMNSG